MHSYTTHDGITVTRRAVNSTKWDACVEVSHPASPIRPGTLYSGGEPIADAVTTKLLAELRRLLSELDNMA